MRDADGAQQVAHAAGELAHREQHVLGGQVVVAEVGALAVGRLEHLVGVGRELGGLRGLPVHLRERAERLVDPVAHGLRRDAEPLEHREHDALGLAEQRREQVLGRHLAVVALPRERLGGLEGLPGLAGELVRVECHVSPRLVDREVDNGIVNF